MFNNQSNQGIDTIQLQFSSMLNLFDLEDRLNQNNISAKINHIGNEIKIKVDDISYCKFTYYNKSASHNSTKIFNKLFKSLREKTIVVEIYGLFQSYTIQMYELIKLFNFIKQFNPFITKLDYSINNYIGYRYTLLLNNSNLQTSNKEKTYITKFNIHYIYIPYTNTEATEIANKALINKIITTHNLKDEVSNRGNYTQWSRKIYHFYNCDHEDTKLKSNTDYTEIKSKYKTTKRVSFYRKFVIKDEETYLKIIKQIQLRGLNVVYSSFCEIGDVVIKIKPRDTEIINYDKSKRDTKEGKLEFYNDDVQISRAELSQKMNIKLDGNIVEEISNLLIKKFKKIKILTFKSPASKKLFEQNYNPKREASVKGIKYQEQVIDKNQIKSDVEAMINLFLK